MSEEAFVKATWRALFLMGLVLTVASCSSQQNPPSAPTSSAATAQATSAPAPAAAPTQVTPLGGLADPDARLFAVTSADTPAGAENPCVFDPATGQFVCPEHTRDGITFTLRFTLYDASGKVQSARDRNTASVRTETTAAGTITRENGNTATVSRRGTMMTTGLGPDAKTHTLNGSEQGTIATTITGKDGATITTNTSIEDTTTNLVVPVRPGDRSAAYPLSGTRVHTAVTKGPGDRGALTVRRQETFDGTNIVKVELTVNGVTQSCTFDLATKTSTCKRD
jgi:hypothetical protein